MEVQQLRYFISVIESGSLSRAAQSLHMSQPALSQQMRNLEQSLRTTLLERSSRGVRPTASGQILYKDAYRLVREFDRLATSVSATTDIHGVVSVGLPSGAAAHLAAPLVTWTLRNHPGIRLELFESMSGYVGELFNHGRLDMALFYEDPLDDDSATSPSIPTSPLTGSGSDVTRVPLYEEEMLAFGGLCALFAHNGIVSLTDMADLPLVAPGRRSSLRRQIDAAFLGESLTPRIIADLESLPTMLEVARSGAAYAILPVSADLERTVPQFHIAHSALRRRAVLKVSKSQATSPSALAAVLEGLRSVTARMIDSDDSAWHRPEAEDRTDRPRRSQR